MNCYSAAPLLVAVWMLPTTCGSETPRQPTTTPPSSSDEVVINGTERIGWDQHVSSEGELQRVRFAVYIDQAASRTELPSASCNPPQNDVAFCSSPLPPLTGGSHTLALVSYYMPDGAESPRASPISVRVAAVSTAASVTTSDSLKGSPSAPTAVLDCAAGLLDRGRAVAAFPTGEIRVLDAETRRESRLEWTAPDGTWTLRAAIGHPRFASNHLVYVLLMREEPDLLPVAVVRFRELNGVLGERATIYQDTLDRVPERPRLRFGRDGKLYVLLFSGGRTAGRLANGESLDDRPFLIRLNEDGTIPGDNPTRSGYVRPTANAPFSVEWLGESRGPLITVGKADGSFEVTTRNGSPVLATVSLRRGVIPIGLHDRRRVADVEDAPDLWATDSGGLAHQLSGGRTLRLAADGPVSMLDTTLVGLSTIAWCGAAAQGEGEHLYAAGITNLPD